MVQACSEAAQVDPCERGAFGVNKWSDVFMRNDEALRREMCVNGEWKNREMYRKAGGEWVMEAKERVLVGGCQRAVPKEANTACRCWVLMWACQHGT
jgi:hypothetical protein